MNHKYVDIKSQKISPEGKAKIQLQIVMHDGACTTFHFNNPVGGADAQKKERDDVKELLQQLLPTFKKKVNKELEEKNRMLSENPGLLQVKHSNLPCGPAMLSPAEIIRRPPGDPPPHTQGVSGFFG